MKGIVTTAIMAAGLAFAQPIMAQEQHSQPDETARVMDMLGKMFVAEPLTAEQEQRLPAARRVAGAMMPDGFYGEMMSGVMDKFLGPLFKTAGPEMIAGQIWRQVGLTSGDLPELDQAQREEISTILDPLAARRTELMTGGMVKGMSAMFAKLEPAMREGVSRAYAVRFTDGELDDISAFFATPTGGKYAAESMLLMADPQVMSGMMQALPAIMGDMSALIESLKQEEARLPRPHGYDDLTPAERTRLATLLGLSAAELKARMSEAGAHAEPGIGVP